MKNLSFLLLIILAISGCEAFIGKEIARVTIDELSQEEDLRIKSITLDVEQYEELHFWTEMDVEYEGDAEILFFVRIYIDGEPDSEFKIDPFEKDITIDEKKVEVMDDVEWSFSGRNMILNAQQSGQYRFDIFMGTGDNPTLKINKAELVIRK